MFILPFLLYSLTLSQEKIWVFILLQINNIIRHHTYHDKIYKHVIFDRVKKINMQLVKHFQILHYNALNANEHIILGFTCLTHI